MNLKNVWMPIVAWVLSIALIPTGPFDWWVNSLAIGAIWAVTFPHRNAHRHGGSFRSFHADFKAGDWIGLMLMMVGEVIAWPVSVPVGGFILRGIYSDEARRA